MVKDFVSLWCVALDESETDLEPSGLFSQKRYAFSSEKEANEFYEKHVNDGSAKYITKPYKITVQKVVTKEKPMDRKTLIINLWGGPGTGKSTGAAYIFSKLKMLGYDCEYVSEYAKDKVWENNKAVFNCQMYVTGKQAFKISRCFGNVDIIVTDAPIRAGVRYAMKQGNINLAKAIDYEANKYKDNEVNILLQRVKPYNQNGRLETEEEAKAIDADYKSLLDELPEPYYTFNADQEGYDRIVEFIIVNKHLEK